MADFGEWPETDGSGVVLSKDGHSSHSAAPLVPAATATALLGVGSVHASEAWSTVQYMAPERMAQGVVSRTADVYAFGMVLLHMLTGHAPFEQYDTGELGSWIVAMHQASKGGHASWQNCCMAFAVHHCMVDLSSDTAWLCRSAFI